MTTPATGGTATPVPVRDGEAAPGGSAAAAPRPASAATAIGMTDEAAARIRALAAAQAMPEAGLRVKVVGGGCSGLTYKMDLDRPREGDKVFEQDGARIVVDRKSFLYVKGTILDFKDDLMSSGFQLQNPNVKRSCGCGSSFVV